MITSGKYQENIILTEEQLKNTLNLDFLKEFIPTKLRKTIKVVDGIQVNFLDKKNTQVGIIHFSDNENIITCRINSDFVKTDNRNIGKRVTSAINYLDQKKAIKELKFYLNNLYLNKKDFDYSIIRINESMGTVKNNSYEDNFKCDKYGGFKDTDESNNMLIMSLDENQLKYHQVVIPYQKLKDVIDNLENSLYVQLHYLFFKKLKLKDESEVNLNDKLKLYRKFQSEINKLKRKRTYRNDIYNLKNKVLKQIIPLIK